MKGEVIAFCGKAGLDWERLSLSGYLEAMSVLSPDYKPGGGGGVSDGLMRFVKAHKG